MIIDLASVGKNPKTIELEFEPANIDLDDGMQLAENAAFNGEISRDGTRTRVKGSITTVVSTECSRCLEPVAKDIHLGFEAVFVDAADEPTEDEIEVTVEELDESLITDDKIDMSEVVREQLILAMIEKVLCQVDCKGLCPQCGGNRNLIDCKCEENVIDPRWAALKNLK
jgi:uncharacterized protein